MRNQSRPNRSVRRPPRRRADDVVAAAWLVLPLMLALAVYLALGRRVAGGQVHTAAPGNPTASTAASSAVSSPGVSPAALTARAAPAPGGTAAPAEQPRPASAGAPAPAPASPLGAILDQVRVETFAPAEIDDVEKRFFVYGNSLPARHAVDWYRVRFASTDRDGSQLPLVAQVFVPRAAGQELPVYTFGPGTTGLRDECAPSHEQPTERNWGDFEAHLLSFAAQGYVAVMPDYPGARGPGGVQYYYIAEMHARAMLDAARAALRFTAGLPPDAGTARAANAIFFAGYSQGGHAALAARDAAATYAPELRVRGVMGYGARGQVSTMLDEAPYLAPYLFYSYARYYGDARVPLQDLLVPTITRSLAEDVTTKCIDEVPAYYGDYLPWIYQPDLLDAVERHRLDQDFPALKQLLDANDAGRARSDIPVLLLQGLADDLVTPDTQRAFVKSLCAAGGTVTYNTYPDIPHVLTRQVSYRDVLDWMDGTLAGRAPRSDCATVR